MCKKGHGKPCPYTLYIVLCLIINIEESATVSLEQRFKLIGDHEWILTLEYIRYVFIKLLRKRLYMTNICAVHIEQLLFGEHQQAYDKG